MKIVIVGSGPAGCAAAIALCRHGHKVVLVGDGKDGVGEQLQPAARPLLEKIGLDALPGQIECVGIRSAWQSSELAYQDFLSHPFGNGWLLDRPLFGRTMRDKAQQEGASLRQPSRLLNLTSKSDGRHRWKLQLTDGVEECDWIVDATGRIGSVGRLLGVKRHRHDRCVAVVGWLSTDLQSDLDQTLVVEKSDGGWWYGCRLPDRRRVAGFVTHRSVSRHAWEMELRETIHLRALTEAYQLEGPLVTRPADSTILEQCYGNHWIAIGDAAVSYDPLASRGLHAALASGLETPSLIGGSSEKLAAWDHDLRQSFAKYLAVRKRWLETDLKP